jgi:uncharacterized protein
MTNALLHDGLCRATWNSRPGSFVGLMVLYESNYIRLRQLITAPWAAFQVGAPPRCSTPREDCPLYLSVDERGPYTLTFTLTYRFAVEGLAPDGVDERPEPDLQVRVYQDARLAEALRCGAWPGGHNGSAAKVGERWRRNIMLNKWLDYCLERGHRFGGP